MTRHSVRTVAWLASVAAVTPLSLAASPVWASPSPGTATAPVPAFQPPFQPPGQPLLLTRVLHSPLADGKEVVARRTYRIVILPDGQGFRVDGVLVDSAIDAPPSLHALAEIERTRPDSDLFPIRLDAGGMIVPTAPPEHTAPSPEADDTLARAATVALAMIQRTPLALPERQQAEGFICKLAAQPAITPWPANLFRPAPGRQIDNRRLELPGGASGLVTVETEASTGGGEGVVSTLQRSITTQLGTSRRTTREEWLLQFAG